MRSNSHFINLVFMSLTDKNSSSVLLFVKFYTLLFISITKTYTTYKILEF